MLIDFSLPHHSTETFSSKSDEHGQEITLTVPGYGKEDLEVSFSDSGNSLLVKSKDKKIDKNIYVANVNLLDLDNVKAKCLNGVLTVTLPYKKVAGKKLQITVE